ncbi:MAG TPA: AI-2E family transporter [Gemmatimonadaceae bacterium]|nr:AI-2E family transporter [Gemmatimonadaceae bacterium]
MTTHPGPGAPADGEPPPPHDEIVTVAMPERRTGRERRHRWAPSHGWRSRDILRATGLVFAFYWLLRLLWFANPLVLAGFLGVLFGLAVTAGVDRLQRFRIPRGVGAFLIVFGSIGAIALFFAWSGPTLAEQSRELRNRFPEALDRIDAWAEEHRGGIIGSILLGGENGAAAGTADTANAPAGAAEPSDAVQAQQQTTARLGGDTTGTPAPQPVSAGSQLRARILGQLSGATQYFFPFLSSTLAVVAGVVLVIFLAIYVAVEPRTYHDGLMHLFPHDARERAGEVLTAIATVLRKWLLTQLIAMLVIGTVTTVVLLLLDVPAAFPLGVLAGLLEFIPTVGPILSAVPAIAMGFVDSPEKALWVAIAYWGIQFMENQLLIPILMREGVDIPPALTIIAQALMALVFGFLGLLVAVPILAAGMVAVKMLYVEGVVGDDIEVFDAGPDDDG